jgi:hypothetical protein
MENGKRKGVTVKANPQKIKVGKTDISIKFFIDKPATLIEDK